MCRRPRRFARGARRSITRCDASDTKEHELSIATDRRIVLTPRLRPCARCLVRRDRSSAHADRSLTRPGARANRSGRSSVHSACRSRRAVAFPTHGDQWATHVDRSSNVKNASSLYAGASDTRWVRSSPHGERCRTRICSVVLAARRFVSSRRRFIFELGCLVQALGRLVQARVRFVSSSDRPRDHGSMDHLLAAPDHSGRRVAFLEAVGRCGMSVDALSWIAAGSPVDRVATTQNSRSFAGLRMTARLVQDDGESRSG
jgi:hypothetical protein